MKHLAEIYVNGAWVEPRGAATQDVVNPATEEVIATVRLGDERDVDLAVAAARAALPSFSTTSVVERLALLDRVIEVYSGRAGDLARTLTMEMGAPVTLAEQMQVPVGIGQLMAARDALSKLDCDELHGDTMVTREPIGVCGFITPWNWPMLLIFAKVAPALAAGCTMVLKPSEVAPLNAIIVAELLDEAGVPPGVFNLVHGVGPIVGAAISAHPDIDMVSFTGSTSAGIDVALRAAPTVKRVAQELGGKSANIVLRDADIAATVARDVAGVFVNSGQSCNAASRILVHKDDLDVAAEAARRAAEEAVVGDPMSPDTQVGPLVSRAQFERVQSMISAALSDGARLITGGEGRPAGLAEGFFVRPTVLADVTEDMAIAREEIFGPVVTLHAYQDEADAVELANATRYGLSNMVSSSDPNKAREVARLLRSGMVHLNGAGLTMDAPFGGYKQSGNGREYGEAGLHEFLETKSIYGYQTA